MGLEQETCRQLQHQPYLQEFFATAPRATFYAFDAPFGTTTLQNDQSNTEYSDRQTPPADPLRNRLS